MASKFIQIINEMYAAKVRELADFDTVHAHYADNQKKWQKQFNEDGSKILEIMHFYEKQLCGKTERSGMGVYSSKLAEKYWEQIKKRYPMIDFIGAKID